MENLLLIVIAFLSVLSFVLLTKLCFLRRSVRELARDFQSKLAEDTNTLIDVSTGDRYIRKLATEINTQLARLRSERRRYQQGDLELKEAVTNISHDLRTPLTAINGYLDLLEKEDQNENVRRYLSLIKNRAEALKNLTEELLCYSVATSVQTLKLQKVDLVRALEESILSFYGAMQQKNISPQITLPEAPLWRELDPGAVSRIFSNIISNALKYSDGDFSVLMDTDGCITFSNTAGNLDSVTVGRLFDRFFTVETGSNSSGLGLSIAKLLTERQEGSIEAAFLDKKLLIKLRFPPKKATVL